MQQAERGASSRDNQGFERFGSGPGQSRSPGQNQGSRAQSGAGGRCPRRHSNGGMARPATSDGSGWRRFSNSTPAQRQAGMSRPSRTVVALGDVQLFRGREIRRGQRARPMVGDWRHFTPQSGGSPDRMNSRMNNGAGMNSGRVRIPRRVTRCRVPRWNQLVDAAWGSPPRAATPGRLWK